MKVEEIRVHEEDPICLLIIIFSPYWRWEVATERCQINWECEWKGKSKQHIAEATAIFRKQ